MTFDQLIDELDSIINPAPVKKEPKDMTAHELVDELVRGFARISLSKEDCLPENYSDKLGYFTTKEY